MGRGWVYNGFMERLTPDAHTNRTKLVQDARDAKRASGVARPSRHIDAAVSAIDRILADPPNQVYAPDPDNDLLETYEHVLAHEVRDGTLSDAEADEFMRTFIHNNFGGAIQLQLREARESGTI